MLIHPINIKLLKNIIHITFLSAFKKVHLKICMLVLIEDTKLGYGENKFPSKMLVSYFQFRKLILS